MARRPSKPKAPAAPKPIELSDEAKAAIAKAAEESKAAAIEAGQSEEDAAKAAADANEKATADAVAAAEAEAKANKGPKLVKMVRDAEAYPDGPHEADVHPAECDEYAAAGWVKA